MKKHLKKLSGILFALLLALSFTTVGCDDYPDEGDFYVAPADDGGGDGGGGC